MTPRDPQPGVTVTLLDDPARPPDAATVDALALIHPPGGEGAALVGRGDAPGRLDLAGRPVPADSLVTALDQLGVPTDQGFYLVVPHADGPGSFAADLRARTGGPVAASSHDVTFDASTGTVHEAIPGRDAEGNAVAHVRELGSTQPAAPVPGHSAAMPAPGPAEVSGTSPSADVPGTSPPAGPAPTGSNGSAAGRPPPGTAVGTSLGHLEPLLRELGMDQDVLDRLGDPAASSLPDSLAAPIPADPREAAAILAAAVVTARTWRPGEPLAPRDVDNLYRFYRDRLAEIFGRVGRGGADPFDGQAPFVEIVAPAGGPVPLRLTSAAAGHLADAAESLIDGRPFGYRPGDDLNAIQEATARDIEAAAAAAAAAAGIALPVGFDPAHGRVAGGHVEFIADQTLTDARDAGPLAEQVVDLLAQRPPWSDGRLHAELRKQITAGFENLINELGGPELGWRLVSSRGVELALRHPETGDPLRLPVRLAADPSQQPRLLSPAEAAARRAAARGEPVLATVEGAGTARRTAAGQAGGLVPRGGVVFGYTRADRSIAVAGIVESNGSRLVRNEQRDNTGSRRVLLPWDPQGPRDLRARLELPAELQVSLIPDRLVAGAGIPEVLTGPTTVTFSLFEGTVQHLTQGGTPVGGEVRMPGSGSPTEHDHTRTTFGRVPMYAVESVHGLTELTDAVVAQGADAGWIAEYVTEQFDDLLRGPGVYSPEAFGVHLRADLLRATPGNGRADVRIRHDTQRVQITGAIDSHARGKTFSVSGVLANRFEARLDVQRTRASERTIARGAGTTMRIDHTGVSVPIEVALRVTATLPSGGSARGDITAVIRIPAESAARVLAELDEFNAATVLAVAGTPAVPPAPAVGTPSQESSAPAAEVASTSPSHYLPSRLGPAAVVVGLDGAGLVADRIVTALRSRVELGAEDFAVSKQIAEHFSSGALLARQRELFGGSLELPLTIGQQQVEITVRAVMEVGPHPATELGNARLAIAVREATATGWADTRGWQVVAGGGVRAYLDGDPILLGARGRGEAGGGATRSNRFEDQSTFQDEFDFKGASVSADIRARIEFDIAVRSEPEIPSIRRWIAGRRTELPPERADVPGQLPDASAQPLPPSGQATPPDNMIDVRATVWAPEGFASPNPDAADRLRPAVLDQGAPLPDDIVEWVVAGPAAVRVLSDLLIGRGFAAKTADSLAHDLLNVDNVTVNYRQSGRVVRPVRDPATNRDAVVIIEIAGRNLRQADGSASLNRKLTESGGHRAQAGRGGRRTVGWLTTSADAAAKAPQDWRTSAPGRSDGRSSRGAADSSDGTGVLSSTQRKFAKADYVQIIGDARLVITVMAPESYVSTRAPAASSGGVEPVGHSGRGDGPAAGARVIDTSDAIAILRRTSPWQTSSTALPTLPRHDVTTADVQELRFVEGWDGQQNAAQRRAVDLVRTLDPGELQRGRTLDELLTRLRSENIERDLPNLWGGRTVSITPRLELVLRARVAADFTYDGTAPGVETVRSHSVVTQENHARSRTGNRRAGWSGEERETEPRHYTAGAVDLTRDRQNTVGAGDGVTSADAAQHRHTADWDRYKGPVELDIVVRPVQSGFPHLLGSRRAPVGDTVGLELTVLVPAGDPAPLQPASSHPAGADAGDAPAATAGVSGGAGDRTRAVSIIVDPEGTPELEIRAAGHRLAGFARPAFDRGDVRLDHVDPTFLGEVREALRGLVGRGPIRDAIVAPFTERDFAARFPALLGADGTTMAIERRGERGVTVLDVRAALFDPSPHPTRSSWLQERQANETTVTTSWSDSHGTGGSRAAAGRFVEGLGETSTSSPPVHVPRGHNSPWELDPAYYGPPATAYAGPHVRLRLEQTATRTSTRDITRFTQSSRDVTMRSLTAGLVLDVTARVGSEVHRLRFHDSTGRAVTLMADAAALLGHPDPDLRAVTSAGVPLHYSKVDASGGVFLPAEAAGGGGPAADRSVQALTAARALRFPHAFTVAAEAHDPARGVRLAGRWLDAGQLADLVAGRSDARAILGTAPSAVALLVPGVPASYASDVAGSLADRLGTRVELVATPDGVMQTPQGVYAGRTRLATDRFSFGEWYTVVAEPGGPAAVTRLPPMTREAADLAEVLGQRVGSGPAPDPGGPAEARGDPPGSLTDHPDGIYPPDEGFYWPPRTSNPHIDGGHPNVRPLAEPQPPVPAADAGDWTPGELSEFLRDFVEVVVTTGGAELVWVRTESEAADGVARAALGRADLDPAWIGVAAHGVARPDGAVGVHAGGRWVPPELLAAAVNKVVAASGRRPDGDQLLICQAGGDYARAYQAVTRRAAESSSDDVWMIRDGDHAGGLVAAPPKVVDDVARPMFGAAGDPLGRFTVSPPPRQPGTVVPPWAAGPVRSRPPAPLPPLQTYSRFGADPADPVLPTGQVVPVGLDGVGARIEALAEVVRRVGFRPETADSPVTLATTLHEAWDLLTRVDPGQASGDGVDFLLAVFDAPEELWPGSWRAAAVALTATGAPLEHVLRGLAAHPDSRVDQRDAIGRTLTGLAASSAAVLPAG
ncbi:hypothetical protein ND748_11820 [Frankia sp. AiPs1]|uniref:hypothetical protein n=1 Tax=Frankia sp. AiPs1 TaxID=573493 RepID=UPI002044CCF0|nr:hypothetical protein [Frankia sp. AiPs1]MCM3922343.1 hypothetical protein [Frankia sp. AiPs1]